MAKKNRSAARMYGPARPPYGGGYGMYVPGQFPKARKARRKAKRRGKRRPSPAQLRARRAFAARARARAKTGMAGRMRAGTRYKRKSASSAQRRLYASAVRFAKTGGTRKKRRKTSKRRKSAGGTVTAAQVVAMAKKGALQRWLCKGRTRTGCGSTGRVTNGTGTFRRKR